MTVDAPSAQGATGFLSRAGAIKLGMLTIQSPLEYGAILLVALDGQPLALSHKMLLQVMSEESNFGWSAPGQGLRQILDVGGPPIVVKRLAGTLALDRPDAAALKVQPLDSNGYPASPAAMPGRGTADAAPDDSLLPDRKIAGDVREFEPTPGWCQSGPRRSRCRSCRTAPRRDRQSCRRPGTSGSRASSASTAACSCRCCR